MGRVFGMVVAVVAWASLILQFTLIVSGHGVVIPGYEPTRLTGIVNFFSYFTILSNIFVALLTTSAVLAPGSALGRFFALPAAAASVETYISVTGLIYFFILRKLWHPEGAQFVADAGLHYASPILFTIYWLFVVPRGRLRLADIPAMLIFPVAYGAYTLIRGAITALIDTAAVWYPYPFISVTELGYGKTLVNMVGVTIVFGVVAAVLLLVDRGLGRAARGG